MSRVAVAGIFDLPAQVRNEALIEAKPLIEGAYTEKGCIHFGQEQYIFMMNNINRIAS